MPVKPIIDEIEKEVIDVTQTKKLPDGGSINAPTSRWLEDLLLRFYGLSEKEKFNRGQYGNI
jgi:hypothetical protein